MGNERRQKMSDENKKMVRLNFGNLRPYGWTKEDEKKGFNPICEVEEDVFNLCMERLRGLDHIERHKRLHKAFDELLADFIAHTEKLPSKVSVVELLEWSYAQTQNPSEEDDYK
jgi:hypothetical protein